MALITVIIPCFNAGPWICQALESVITQGISDMEIIVVDDGSTDKSADIIEKEFPNIHLIRTKNQGASRARNVGTQLSRGEFIQYLDADDLLAPNKLKIQLEMLQNSGADVAYGDWQRLVQRPDNEFIKGEKLTRRLQDPEIDLFTDIWCPPAAILFRRAIVEKVGAFNEGLPIIQDARFSLDCALQGAKFICCPGIMAYHRLHPGSLSRKDQIAFIRDCLNNAIEIEKWWQRHAGIDAKRKKALLKVYGYVARASFEKDKMTFESAHRALERLKPGYIPERPIHLRLASKLIGYKRAEFVALWYRQIKKYLLLS